ncbi:hypothetical protein C6P91_15590 [Burkholderia multivorans]|nr:hypothetical protein C6P91_15590 [Burkholderia multivorans]
MRRSGRYTVRSTCHAGIFYNSEYHVYEVAKPIEGVRAGPAEPWFRQPGGRRAIPTASACGGTS